jgi:hypothetical protein
VDASERDRLVDQQAEAYDRVRPTYPDAVIDELLTSRQPTNPARRPATYPQ